MKASIEFTRKSETPSAALVKGGMQTGAAIRSVTVRPEDARLIRDYTAQNRRMLRMYEAAITTQYNTDFMGTYGSANAEILASLYKSRANSRTLCKDYGTAKGIIRTVKNNVAGDDPFRLEEKYGTYSADGKTFTLDEKTNKTIEDAWEEAGKKKNCTVRRDMTRLEMYHCVVASMYRDGGLLARKWDDYPENKFGFALELIERDRLQENWMGKGQGGNVVRFSIERDRWNAPVAYWILTRHPGDLFMYNGPDVQNTWRVRVPAENIIDFNAMRDRAEQDVGMTELDSIIQYLHRDRQFDVAHVTAAIWACCKPFFITRNKPTANEYTGDEQSQAGEKITTNEPATGEILPDGYGVELVDPKFPIESATAFKRDNMLGVCQGTGLSYGSVTGDFEKYSFSSARAAQVPERDYFRVLQQHVITSFVQDYFESWLETAILKGAIDLPISKLADYCKAATWHAKNWEYIQPVQDAQADIMLMEANLKSPQEILAESANGRSFSDVMADKASANQIAKAHGIDLTPLANMPTIKKGEPGTQDNSQGQPEDEPEPGKNRIKLNGNGHVKT